MVSRPLSKPLTAALMAQAGADANAKGGLSRYGFATSGFVKVGALPRKIGSTLTRQHRFYVCDRRVSREDAEAALRAANA